MTLQETFERFSAFECERGLFKREVCGVRYWHLVRFPIYSTQVLPHFTPMGAAHPDGVAAGVGSHERTPLARRIVNGIRLPIRNLVNRVRFSPSVVSAPCDILFSLAPRVTRLEDGRRVRLMVDFFADRLKHSWGVLEAPTAGTGYARHDAGGRIFRWSAIDRRTRVFRESSAFAACEDDLLTEARWLTAAMRGCLGWSPEEPYVFARLRSALALDKAASPILKRWLARLSVKGVVESVHYDQRNLVLTKAAHERGLPVIEMQHGTVYAAHLAYNLPTRDTPYAPDYLLGWGDHWLRQTENVPLCKAVATGYPFLDHERRRFPRRPTCATPTVLFISQGTVGPALARMAVELRGLLPTNRIRIVYKLHPDERRTWRTLYPSLVAGGIEVADRPDRSIYSYLAEADAVVGAYSTAVIEGFTWGVKAFLPRELPGVDTMVEFCRGGAADYVDDVRTLAMRLENLFGHRSERPAAFADGAFWVENAAERTASAIDTIVAAPPNK